MRSPGKKCLIVVGGGAAGFFCALRAAALYPEIRVVILEKTGKLLSKVAVSGGGRCNVTHQSDYPSELIKQYPRGGTLLKKSFHQFFVKDTINWFAERGVALKVEADGRMFPVTDSSQTIIDCFLQEAAALQVECRLHANVSQVSELHGAMDQKTAAGRFEVVLANGEKLRCDWLVVATGGLHHPAGYPWLKSLGHDIEKTVPSLFTINLPKHPITQLMGVSVGDVQVSIPGTRFVERGPLLITHWGLSGPAVLRLSAWAAFELAERAYQCPVRINWLPELHEQSASNLLAQWRQEKASAKIGNKHPFVLPARLWEYHLKQTNIDAETRWADLKASQQHALAKQLCLETVQMNGKTTFKEEFVTAGGISLQDVHAHSLESRIHPGLFFAGEVLNVDGVTGGYNFQHAWTSGWIVAEHLMDAPPANLC
jgi:predicted Rossmann fold flavoprotein